MFIASVSATYSTHLIFTALYHYRTLILRTALLYKVIIMKRPDFIVQGVYKEALRFFRRSKNKNMVFRCCLLLAIGFKIPA
jgi:hypothetical protein